MYEFVELGLKAGLYDLVTLSSPHVLLMVHNTARHNKANTPGECSCKGGGVNAKNAAVEVTSHGRD